jgi:hypothetical protein
MQRNRGQDDECKKLFGYRTAPVRPALALARRDHHLLFHRRDLLEPDPHLDPLHPGEPGLAPHGFALRFDDRGKSVRRHDSAAIRQRRGRCALQDPEPHARAFHDGPEHAFSGISHLHHESEAVHGPWRYRHNRNASRSRRESTSCDLPARASEHCRQQLVHDLVERSLPKARTASEAPWTRRSPSRSP